MKSHSIAGSSFVVHPIERHLFEEGANDFLCSICNRPRALHQFDGFIPNTQRPKICMKRSVRFGRHPRFTRPGSMLERFTEQEVLQIDWARKMNAP